MLVKEWQQGTKLARLGWAGSNWVPHLGAVCALVGEPAAVAVGA